MALYGNIISQLQHEWTRPAVASGCSEDNADRTSSQHNSAVWRTHNVASVPLLWLTYRQQASPLRTSLLPLLILAERKAHRKWPRHNSRRHRPR